MTPREHTTDGLDCWCLPRYAKTCRCTTVCAQAQAGTLSGFCTGVLYITREEAEARGGRCIIFHNAEVS